MTLSNATLATLPAGVSAPGYDRALLTPGIIHIGCGNFHRAHMAVYLDDLFATGQSHDWAIKGAGVRDGDARMHQTLAAQDYLYSVIELAPGANSARVIGAMTDFVPVAHDNGPLIAAMADPNIRIVSLTVTEGGYFIDPATAAFNPNHPDVLHDGSFPDRPRTAFGAIVAALRIRRGAGTAPFTVMCCDNLPHNGKVTASAVVGVARLSDPELADWIASHVAFPNSMVDRITPATGPREIDMASRLGLADAAPVTCEPYRQWVMEDNFSAGRPALEKVGVVFTDRVDAFETMKIRILNGGHAIIAYPGGLADIEYVHEAMASDRIRAFLDAILTREVLPIVPPVPGVDLSDYKALIIDRFSNPMIADTVRRLCHDGSNRQPKFIVPSIRDGLAQGRDVTGLILLSALWCRYCAGTTENGTPIAPNDPNWHMLTARAADARLRPQAWLEMTDVYGPLGQDPRFATPFAKALKDIWTRGSIAVIHDYLGAPKTPGA